MKHFNFSHCILAFVFMFVNLSVFGEGKNEFIIRGKVPAEIADGTRVSLVKFSLTHEEKKMIATASIRGGEFVIAGKCEEKPFMASISLKGYGGHQLIIEPGEITIEINDAQSKGMVSGTPINDDYYKYVTEPHNASKKFQMQEFGRETWSGEFKDTGLDYMSLMKKELEFIKKYVLYPDVVLWYLYKFYITNVEYERSERPNPWEKSKELIAALPGEHLDRIVAAHKTREEEPVRSNERPQSMVVEKYADFLAYNSQGENVRLSELIQEQKPRLVLLDFWASGASSSFIKGMPTLAQLHEKYGQQGVMIVGVSLDDSRNRDKWIDVIEEHQFFWTQLYSPVNESGNARSIYGITSIPNTILFDSEGMVIAQGLRGDALRKKIEGIME